MIVFFFIDNQNKKERIHWIAELSQHWILNRAISTISVILSSRRDFLSIIVVKVSSLFCRFRYTSSWISPSGKSIRRHFRKEKRWHVKSRERTKPRHFFPVSKSNRRRGNGLEAANDSCLLIERSTRHSRLFRRFIWLSQLFSIANIIRDFERVLFRLTRRRKNEKKIDFSSEISFSRTSNETVQHDVAAYSTEKGVWIVCEYLKRMQKTIDEKFSAGEENARMKTMGDVVADSVDENDGTAQPTGTSKEFGQRTLRSLKRGLGRLWRRHRGNASITEYDPCYKVAYLGNVLTGWAKGEWYLHFVKSRLPSRECKS